MDRALDLVGRIDFGNLFFDPADSIKRSIEALIHGGPPFSALRPPGSSHRSWTTRHENPFSETSPIFLSHWSRESCMAFRPAYSYRNEFHPNSRSRLERASPAL